jgi:hypothetical protein
MYWPSFPEAPTMQTFRGGASMLQASGRVVVEVFCMGVSWTGCVDRQGGLTGWKRLWTCTDE